jgi:prepilin-type processing-associated H-X9-DG protein
MEPVGLWGVCRAGIHTMLQDQNDDEIVKVESPGGRVSGQSVAALVLGLICMCLGPLGLIPIVVGVFALADHEGQGSRHSKTLAIAGVVLGAAGVLGTVFWVMAYYRVRERTQFLYAESSLRAHSQSLVIYATNNDKKFPTKEQWPDALIELNMVDPDFSDWTDRDGDGVSYVYLPGQIYLNATKMLVYEDPKHWGSGVLVGFADGHVEMIDHETFEQMLADQLAAQSSP